MDKRKPAAVLIAAILAAGMFLSGCSREPQSVSYPVIGTWTEGMKATDEQAQLARDMSCSEKEIKRMQEEGMSQNEFKNVAYARWGLDYLSERYPGETFRALWLVKPNIYKERHYYSLTVEIVGGPYDGERIKFEFNENCVPVSGDGDYWVIIHREDWETYVEGFLAPVVSGLPEGTCVAAARAGNGVKAWVPTILSEPFEDHRRAFAGYAYVYVLPSASMSDEDYDAFVDALVAALTETGVSVRLNVARLTSVPDGVDLSSEERPWSFVDNDIEERYVDVGVHYSGTFDYYTDEREPDQDQIQHEQINQSGGTDG